MTNPETNTGRLRSLVTGGAGFVGSHLCDRLLAEGHDVVALDNLYTGRLENLAHLADNPHFRLIEHDVTEPFPDLGGSVDRIWNLACPASPIHYQRDPLFTLKTSFLGTLHALQRAQADDARLLHASTSEVYGDPAVHPQSEAYWGHVNPIGPRACYDEGKRVAETLCVAFHDRGVPVRIARIFNTYGPRMDPADGRVVSNFVVQALRGEPLTIYGDGTQTRSFCHVTDLVEGLFRLMAHREYPGPVNLGNPGEFTVGELAEQVLLQTRSKSALKSLPLPTDDPTRRRPDIAVATRLLDYRPSIPLAQGLQSTVEYFRTQLGEDDR